MLTLGFEQYWESQAGLRFWDGNSQRWEYCKNKSQEHAGEVAGTSASLGTLNLYPYSPCSEKCVPLQPTSPLLQATNSQWTCTCHGCLLADLTFVSDPSASRKWDQVELPRQLSDLKWLNLTVPLLTQASRSDKTIFPRVYLRIQWDNVCEMPTIAMNSASHWVVIIGLCLSLFLGHEPHRK